MASSTSWRVAGHRALFFALSMAGIFVLLVPVSMMPSNVVWPEVMLLAVFALTIRAPEIVPYWLVGIVFLLADFLLSLPLGLGVLIALLSSQFLLRNRPAFFEMLFLGEWFSISLLLIAASIVREVLLAITLAERTPWWGWFSQIGLSILIYPLIVGLVTVLFRVTKVEESISFPIRRRT